MGSCLIFGGAGYIGTKLAEDFLDSGRFDTVYLADLRPGPLSARPGVITLTVDVRQPIDPNLLPTAPDWIVNLAAVHREPGHAYHEYFDTNLPGARHVCEFADAVACSNMLFTSSIAVYGPTGGPTSESSPLYPTTAYGISKLAAELIHEGWFKSRPGRRLLICRPGVIYGPGDPGNILRMIRLIQKGRFFIPGSPTIRKSYGYIFGLIASMRFFMDQSQGLVRYNYVENPTEPLGEVVRHCQRFFQLRESNRVLPLWMLLPVARGAQLLLRNKSPIHPLRVRKAATSTHIVPQVLIDRNFSFRYDFVSSLADWSQRAPLDFAC